MQSRISGSEYRTTIVCIDSYDKGNPTGRCYNPYNDDGETFESLTQFLVQMEDRLNAMSFPQSFTAIRTFAPPSPHPPGTPLESKVVAGQLATFAVRILFRQNASWQGSVSWLEGDQTQSFRSALEMVFLIDSVLNQPKADTAASP